MATEKEAAVIAAAREISALGLEAAEFEGANWDTLGPALDALDRAFGELDGRREDDPPMGYGYRQLKADRALDYSERGMETVAWANAQRWEVVKP